MGGSSSKKKGPPPFHPTPHFESSRSWEPAPPLTLRDVLIERKLPKMDWPYVVMNTDFRERPIHPPEETLAMRIARAHEAITKDQSYDDEELDDTNRWLMMATWWGLFSCKHRTLLVLSSRTYE